MTARRVLLAAGVGALFLIWFFGFRGGEEGAAPIERRARLDLLAACNEAAAASGAIVRFALEDITTRVEAAEAEGGVVALVSAFEARREGRLCKWNGLDPARIVSAD